MERGLAALQEGELDQAMRDFIAAQELMPDSIAPLVAIGDIYHAQGQPEIAIEKYREALVLDPSQHKVHFMIGFVSKMALGDLATALAELTKAVELDSTFAMYHYQLGDVLHGLERYDGALDRFERAIAINPDHGGAHYSIGEIYDRHKDMPDEAFSWYEKSVALNPTMPQLRQLVGDAYGRHDRYDDALRHLREYLKLAPEGPAAESVKEGIRYLESQQGVTP
jgi:tetratricopeptide (TPR) repeat protein